MKSYRVFTIASGQVTPGAVIETLHLKGAGIDIPVIMVGEEGRGRERGVVPVGNPPMVSCPERGQVKTTFILNDPGPKPERLHACDRCGESYYLWELYSFNNNSGGGQGWKSAHPDTGVVRSRLMFAEVGQTNAGKPKLWAKDKATTDEKIIVVFRTSIGFRGGNSHTGDRAGWKCSKYGCDASGDGAVNAPETCPKCGATGSWDGGPKPNFAAFPGEIIARGYIAQGAAGRAGGGEHIIALIPKDVVFRTSYSGRLYGTPGSHYYKWDNEKVLAVTWDERAAADLF